MFYLKRKWEKPRIRPNYPTERGNHKKRETDKKANRLLDKQIKRQKYASLQYNTLTIFSYAKTIFEVKAVKVWNCQNCKRYCIW